MIPDAGRDDAARPGDPGHLAEAGDRIGHEVDDELGERGIEGAVLERDRLGAGLADVDPREPVADGRDERRRRIERGHVIRADARDELPGQGARPRPDVEDALTGPDPGEVGHLRRQQPREPAHESVVRLGGDIEAHRVTISRE